MPENMSDRMPEDLPVTKCINVMVGITRSKVFCFLLFFLLHHQKEQTQQPSRQAERLGIHEVNMQHHLLHRSLP